MADYLKVEIQGLKELEMKLLALPEKVSRKYLKSATNAGAAVIRKDARERAPVYTGSVQEGHPPPGTLKKSIITKFDNKNSDLFNATYNVQIKKTGGGTYANTKHNVRKRRAGKKYSAYGDGDAYYAHMVERGTVKMSPRPYLRPAFESKKMEAVEAIKTKLAARIEEEAAAK